MQALFDALDTLNSVTYAHIPHARVSSSVRLYALTFIAFLNQSSVPFTMVSRAVAYKLTDAGLFGELPYVIAVLASSAPLAVATDVLFAIPFYFLVTLAMDAGRFFFFLLVVVLQDFATSTLYRALSYAAPSEEGAMVACGLLIAVGLSLGNYFVIATQVGWWLRWLIYISPFYWSETAAVNNEFSSSKYASPFPGSPQGSPSQGALIMSSFDCESTNISNCLKTRTITGQSRCFLYSPIFAVGAVGRYRRPPCVVAAWWHPSDVYNVEVFAP